MKIKDPVSSFTHMSFAIVALPTTAVLVCLAAIYGTVWHIVSLSVYGASLFALYFSSAAYHAYPKSGKSERTWRKVDHMMIFVLIAGTYTPICLISLRGVWGYTLLILIWSIAVGGILMKAFWINAPRVLTTGIYVAMGWIVVIAFVPLAQNVSTAGLALLLSGGITYTLGAVIYAIKWPKMNFKLFGFHELFHIFVMVGTVLHTVLMFMLIWTK